MASFKSLQDFLDLVNPRGPNPLRARQARKAVNEAAGENGLDLLVRLQQKRLSDAKDLSNNGSFTDTLMSVIHLGFSKSTDVPSHEFRLVIGDLLHELKLVPGIDDAKKENLNGIGTGVQEYVWAEDATPPPPPPPPPAPPAPPPPPPPPAPPPQAKAAVLPELPWDPLDDIGTGVQIYVWPGVAPAGVARIGAGELMRLPGILPPAPLNGSGDTYSSWLDGEPGHVLGFGIKLKLGPEDDIADLFEMQSEFFASPQAAFSTYNARKPIDATLERGDGLRLIELADSLGRYGSTVPAAAEAFSKSIARYLDEYEPRTSEFLSRVGCEIRCSSKLAFMISAAIDIEAHFIDNGPSDASGRPHDLRGSISHSNRLDVPHIVDAAVFRHFQVGAPVTASMMNCLIELRHAQVCRQQGELIKNERFDAVFLQDWFADLKDYDFQAGDVMDMSPG